MRTILHVLTRPMDEVTQQVINHQQALAETKVEVADLENGTPDYDELLNKIFSADSIQVS